MNRRLWAIAAGLGLLVGGCAEPNPPPSKGQIKVNAPGVDLDVQTKGGKKVDVDINRKD
jgi:hypothetical protein